MGTKVKGLFKGLRYISQIFDEPKKEAEFQIGTPTDVKHVAHIGWDNNGPAVSSPSWMKSFESTEGGNNSSPATVEDSSKGIGESAVIDSPKKEKRSSRRRHSKTSSGSIKLNQDENVVSDSPESGASEKKEKSRSSRRRHSKNSSESIKLKQDKNAVFDSHARDLPPDIPKKRSLRKKIKDSSSSRSKNRSLGSASNPESSLKSYSTKENVSSQAG